MGVVQEPIFILDAGSIEDDVDLTGFKSGDLQINARIQLEDFRERYLELGAVPVGLLSNSVQPQPEGLHLRLLQVVDRRDRHLD